MWILIRRIRQIPADLDIQCFQKRINPDLTGQRLKVCSCIICVIVKLNKHKSTQVTVKNGMFLRRVFISFEQVLKPKVIILTYFLVSLIAILICFDVFNCNKQNKIKVQNVSEKSLN